MFTKQHHISNVIGLTIFFIVMILSNDALSEVKGDIELLKLVANGYNSNLQQIRTWKGNVKIYVNWSKGNQNIERKHSIEFLNDIEAGKLRWYWNQQEGKFTGDNTLDESPYFTSGIVKEKVIHRLFPVPVTSDRTPGNVTIEPLESEIKGYNDEFNPMHYFKVIERNMYNRLMFFYDNSQDIETDAKVERIGDIVIFELSSKENKIVNRYEFDLTKGCCLVKYTAIGNVNTVWNFDYEQLDGIFVPKKINYDYTDNEQVKHVIRTFEFFDNSLNKQIDPNEFDLDKLGLQSGDRIQDLFIGIDYRYNDPMALELESSLALSDTIVDSFGNNQNVSTSVNTTFDSNDYNKLSDKSQNKSGEQESQVLLESQSDSSKTSNRIYLIIFGCVLIIIVMNIIHSAKKHRIKQQ